MKKRVPDPEELVGFTILALIVLTAIYFTGVWRTIWDLVDELQPAVRLMTG